jgi:hypothetical protein
MYRCINGRRWLGSLVVSSVVAAYDLIETFTHGEARSEKVVEVFEYSYGDDARITSTITLSYDRTMAGPRLMMTSRVIQSGWIK